MVEFFVIIHLTKRQFAALCVAKSESRVRKLMLGVAKQWPIEAFGCWKSGPPTAHRPSPGLATNCQEPPYTRSAVRTFYVKSGAESTLLPTGVSSGLRLGLIVTVADGQPGDVDVPPVLAAELGLRT